LRVIDGVSGFTTAMNFKIGVDGGGTKTDFILIDESGDTIARRHSGGCNPSLIGSDAARALITTQLNALVGEARSREPNASLSHTLFCMAGSRPFWREFGATLTDCGEVQTFDDSVPVLELATNGSPGLVLHAGTGSFVAARDTSGGTHYAGGLGWRFGDPASAYDLGRHAIGRAILELQGWAELSGVSAMICEATGLNDSDSVTRHYYNDDLAHTTIAAVAPRVTEIAANGDQVAREIVANSVYKLAELARDVVARVMPEAANKSLIVGLSGAIPQTPIAREAIASVLGSSCEWVSVNDAPIEGVRRLLARL